MEEVKLLACGLCRESPDTDRCGLTGSPTLDQQIYHDVP